MHAATRAGALDVAGREKLLRYVLRPPIAQERVEPQKDGLVRITLKREDAQVFVTGAARPFTSADEIDKFLADVKTQDAVLY